MDENLTSVAANPNTSSLPPEVTANLHTATGIDRALTVLFRKQEELDRKVHELETKKILDETQIPPEILAQNGMLPPDPQTVKRGRGFRPLLRSEIEDAIKVSPFCSEQAKSLGIAVSTLRKYAKPLGLWKPQPHHKGSRKAARNPEFGKYPLSKVLAGEFNGNKLVLEHIVRGKLIRAKTFPEQCAVCGYDKRHLVTKKVALLIDHMDGDRYNWKLENIRLLCWNCTIECGRGYLRRGIRFFDPNWRED